MTVEASDLSADYASTCFEAMTPDGLVSLHIGEASAALTRLMTRLRVVEAAFITAWNPGNRPVSSSENDHAHSQLLLRLQSLQVTYFEGYGRDPTGRWPAERSVLVLGITEADASELGRRFGQAAIVIAGIEGIPRLRWLQ